MNRWGIKFCLKIFFGIIFFGALLGFVVMSLWNWLLPELFAVSKISFLQALGILALSKILFGSFKGYKSGCCNGAQCNSGGLRSHWKKKWEDKLASMSPEEREKVKESYKKCCGISKEETKENT